MFFYGSALYILLLAFGVISLYREGAQIARYLGERMPVLKVVHDWLARHETTPGTECTSSDIDVWQLSQSLISVASELQKKAGSCECKTASK